MNKYANIKINSRGKLSEVPYDYVFSISDFPLAIMPQLQRESPGWHHHDEFYEIVLVVSGKGTHICEKKKYPLQPQEILVIEPGMHHSYDTEAFSYYNVLVNFERLQLPLFDLKSTVGFQNLFVLAPQSHNTPNGNPLRHILPAEDYTQALQLIKKIYELQKTQTPGFQIGMVRFFIEFLQVICQATEKTPRDSFNSALKSQVISTLAVNLAKHCHKHWTVEKMCKECGMSRSMLFGEFKKYYNVSPVLFLNNQRLRKVCVLLEKTDKDLEYIAGECGFANGSYLATVFKRTYNTTPLKYRWQQQNQQQLK